MLDASALLALVFGEPGAEGVADRIAAGAAVSAVNLSEVATVLVRNDVDADDVLGPLRQQLAVEPFTEDDALAAAAMYPQGVHLGLSLGDRACLATARRLGSKVASADRSWVDLEVGVKVDLIRDASDT